MGKGVGKIGKADLPPAGLVAKDFHSGKMFSPLCNPNGRDFSEIGVFSRGLRVVARGDDKLFLRLCNGGEGPTIRVWTAEVASALRELPAILTGVLLPVRAVFFLLQDFVSELITD